MHIGLIGGIGPAATSFYYQNLVRVHAEADREMELTIVHASARDLIQNVADDARDRQAQIFLGLVRRLQAAGADAVGVTSIAGHFCIGELEKISPLPIINALPELEAELVRRGLTRVALLGTRVVMGSVLYGGLNEVEVVVPEGDDFEAVHRDYIAMATAGQATDAQRDTMFTVGKKLHQDQGAEMIVLAGTDLFLAFDGRPCDFPVLDSALVHIEALFRASGLNL